MAQYYDTTPWLIPKADDRLAALFRQHGSFFRANYHFKCKA